MLTTPSAKTLRRAVGDEVSPTMVSPAMAFVRRVGEVFENAALTPEERAIVKAAIGRKRFRLRECFHNTQRIVRDDESGEIAYVEGFRASAPHALHAWASLRGKVIDVTKRPTDMPLVNRAVIHPIPLMVVPERVMGTFARSEAYFGVAFTRKVLAATPSRRGNSLLDDWEANWPVENGSLARFRIGVRAHPLSDRVKG